METLRELRRDWEQWAVGADKSEDGWQSDYPRWDELMSAARTAMANPGSVAEHFSDIEFCWAISEGGEDLADYARDNVGECWDLLQRLAHSESRDVRWQAYDAIGFAGAGAEPVLREGLHDPDSYVRRRALDRLQQLGSDGR